MPKEPKKPYVVNKHFAIGGTAYGLHDTPMLTDKEAAAVLAKQDPQPDGKDILPTIEAVKPKAAKPV